MLRWMSGRCGIFSTIWAGLVAAISGVGEFVKPLALRHVGQIIETQQRDFDFLADVLVLGFMVFPENQRTGFLSHADAGGKKRADGRS
jgi:hypothetical protein